MDCPYCETRCIETDPPETRKNNGIVTKHLFYKCEKCQREYVEQTSTCILSKEKTDGECPHS